MAAVDTTAATPYLPEGLRGKYLLQEPAFVHSQGVSADIEWIPNYEKYTRRVKARSGLPGAPRKVPNGWPEFLDSLLAWTTDSFSDQEPIYTLTEDQK